LPHNFINIQDALPKHTTVTRTKRQFDLVTLGIATAALTLATYNTVQISKVKNKITANEKKLDHLIDITNLHKQHFKAVDTKLDDISNQLATMFKSTRSTLPKLLI
jgi:hypothetical protein